MQPFAIAFLIAALVLFIIETARSKSLQSAGLACVVAAMLVPLVQVPTYRKILNGTLEEPTQEELNAIEHKRGTTFYAFVLFPIVVALATVAVQLYSQGMSEEKRYQLAARLHREGLSKPAVAKQMGITTAGVHDMIKQAERRERIAKAVDDAKDKPMDERGFIEAGLSIRSVNALLCWGDVIGGETIGHLRKWWASVPPHKRLQVPNLGKKSVEEIDALLERTWPNASEEGQEQPNAGEGQRLNLDAEIVGHKAASPNRQRPITSSR